MKVRRATATDAAAVAALWTEAYSDDPRGGRMNPYAPGEALAVAEEGEVLVAEDDVGLAGVVVLYQGGLREGQFALSGEVELSRLAVAVRQRRRGLGKRLMHTCLTRARQQRASALVLWSQRHQTEAHDLYRSLGFERAPERDEQGEDGM
jgi:ribosomal protein S18 acetylase RimI-like enzyme